MTDLLTRRAFMASLAVAGVAAGLPLPVGWRQEGIAYESWQADLYDGLDLRPFTRRLLVRAAEENADWLAHMKEAGSLQFRRLT